MQPLDKQDLNFVVTNIDCYNALRKGPELAEPTKLVP
jgi:hypothetical protein